jgi:hypothetical protein
MTSASLASSRPRLAFVRIVVLKRGGDRAVTP